MFSNNVQYQIKESFKVLLSNEEKILPKGMLTFVEKNLIITPLDADENVSKTNKLTNKLTNKFAGVTEVIMSLNELDDTDNLQNGRLSNVLLRHYLTSSKAFTNFEPVTPQYKKLRNREFTSLILRIKDQNNNSITNGLEMTIVFHII